MWTCHNCENTNPDDVHVCPVCGATSPDVHSVVWENAKGKDPEKKGKATVRWDGSNLDSVFAVFGDKSYHLTDKTEATFDVPATEQSGIIYFCSTGGYVEYHFILGSSDPIIKVFRVYNTLRPGSPFKFGDLASVEWETVNGDTAVASSSFDPVFVSAGIGYKRFIVCEEETDIDISVTRRGYDSALAELTIKATPVIKPTIDVTIAQGSNKNPHTFNESEDITISYTTTNCKFVRIGDVSPMLPPNGTYKLPYMMYKRYGTHVFDIIAYTDDVDTSLYDVYFNRMMLSGTDAGILESIWATKKEIKFTIGEPDAKVTFDTFSDEDLEDLHEGDIVQVDWTFSSNAKKYYIKNNTTGKYLDIYTALDGTNRESDSRVMLDVDYFTKTQKIYIKLAGGTNSITVGVRNASGKEDTYTYSFEAKPKLSTRLKLMFKHNEKSK